MITAVANATGEVPEIAENTWVEIKGVNLAPAGVSSPDCAPGYCWQGPDFVNNQLPIALHGVSVMVNGQPAFVYYISPTQVNVLTPLDARAAAPLTVTSPALIIRATCEREYSGARRVEINTSRRIRSCAASALRPAFDAGGKFILDGPLCGALRL